MFKVGEALRTRTASEEDIQVITSFTLKLHQHEDDGQLKTSDDFYNKLSRWISFEIRNPQSLFLLAEHDQSVVGFIGATLVINDNGFLQDPLKGIIQLLWIEPEYRQHKIAQQLVTNVEETLKLHGVNYIECQYTLCNQQAKEFWRKNGYNDVATLARKIL